MQYVIKSGDGDRVKVEKNHLYSKYDTLTILDKTARECELGIMLTDQWWEKKLFSVINYTQVLIQLSKMY